MVSISVDKYKVEDTDLSILISLHRKITGVLLVDLYLYMFKLTSLSVIMEVSSWKLAVPWELAWASSLGVGE